MGVRGYACVRWDGGGVRYMMWHSLCECVRSTPITTTSTATLFSTLVHSVHFNSSHCGGPSLLHSYVRRSLPTAVMSTVMGLAVHVMEALSATSAVGAADSGRALSTELVATDTDSATSLHTSMATVGRED